MTVWHTDLHKRKKTGGRKGAHRKRRRFERGRDPLLPTVGEDEKLIERTRGGNFKVRVRYAKHANVFDGSKTVYVEILKVVQNPANPDFTRMGVLTKGALIETPIGTARVTSKPSIDGVVNAVLVQAKSS
ncbi:MAG: 30S ribosomal protein S8e [Thaumarchaeota archaeon]|nr:30S ribosomal protein S8e [Candidatus Calditenuaceae archaeon]MDW8187600.1 30S ribosomal protein S8e [Nitrososphaerota archaeon]